MLRFAGLDASSVVHHARFGGILLIILKKEEGRFYFLPAEPLEMFIADDPKTQKE
jgi:hypothetical protein